MNFVAHTCIAAAHSEHPRFLLGSMLPDLTSMIGVRINEVFDAELRAGITHHHEADSAFHSAPVFAELCGAGIAQLGARGVERGTARAVAHVGTELLLDGVLSVDTRARDRYRGALDHVRDTGLAQMLTLRRPEDLPSLQTGIARLSGAPLPEGYRNPEFVAARLLQILGRRPRLAMRDGDLPGVLDWLCETRVQLLDRHDVLLAEVHAALRVAPSSY